MWGPEIGNTDPDKQPWQGTSADTVQYEYRHGTVLAESNSGQLWKEPAQESDSRFEMFASSILNMLQVLSHEKAAM